MIDLLVDGAIFTAVKAGKDNLYQLSGIPISELEPLAQAADKSPPSATGLRSAELRPSEITFVRSRMLYARAALNARGLVHFGLRHIRMYMSTPFLPQKVLGGLYPHQMSLIAFPTSPSQLQTVLMRAPYVS